MGQRTWHTDPFVVDVIPDDQGNPWVSARGELDMATTTPLRDAVLGRLGARPSRVVLDLSGLTFIDCSGLAALLELQRACGAAQSVLVLGSESEPVRKLLGICDLTEQFPRIIQTDSTLISASDEPHQSERAWLPE